MKLINIEDFGRCTIVGGLWTIVRYTLVAFIPRNEVDAVGLFVISCFPVFFAFLSPITLA